MLSPYLVPQLSCLPALPRSVKYISLEVRRVVVQEIGIRNSEINNDQRLIGPSFQKEPSPKHYNSPLPPLTGLGLEFAIPHSPQVDCSWLMTCPHCRASHSLSNLCHTYSFSFIHLWGSLFCKCGVQCGSICIRKWQVRRWCAYKPTFCVESGARTFYCCVQVPFQNGMGTSYTTPALCLTPPVQCSASSERWTSGVVYSFLSCSEQQGWGRRPASLPVQGTALPG